jgi:predicted transcriptional regulator
MLSIKPEYAFSILAGRKRFEFRRCIFRRPVTRVVIYASAPISKVIGEFEIEELIHDDLDPLWRKTQDHAGITKEYFYSYFSDCDKGYAIKVANPKRYDEPQSLQDGYGMSPPQSFAYVD